MVTTLPRMTSDFSDVMIDSERCRRPRAQGQRQR